MLSFEVRPGRVVSGPARLVALLLVVALALAGLPLRPAATPSLLAASWQLPSHSAIGDLLGLEDGAAARPDPSEAHISRVAQASFGKLPLSFVPNLGQSDAAVRFQARGLGGTLSFRPEGMVLSLPGAAVGHGDKKQTEVVHLRFVSANAAPAVLGGDRLPGVVNLFIGNDPAQWQRNLPTYADIIYKALYPGIDLRYDGREGQLKGTFSVAPGADPSRIRWRYHGATGRWVDEQGNLHITLPIPATAGIERAGTNGGRLELVEHTPVAWQDIGGRRVPVSVSYRLGPDATVSFAVGPYDAAYPLILDPILTYSTYLGGGGSDDVSGIAVDSVGNIYVTGVTYSGDFPSANALQPTASGKIFVAKLNPRDNILEYRTFLENGRSTDIAVDEEGNAYVVGETASCCLALANIAGNTTRAGQDAFVTKLDERGEPVYSTLLGGSYGDGATGIAVEDGRAYIVGYTYSPDFPATSQHGPRGGTDTFVAELNRAGDTFISRVRLGGKGGDMGNDITVAGRSVIAITGITTSDDFPTTTQTLQAERGGNDDAFVARLNMTDESLTFSTFLGGAENDFASGIALDSAGNIHVSGWTESPDFPIMRPLQGTNNGRADVFVSKLSAAGNGFIYSTYLGGEMSDASSAIVVDQWGSSYIVGLTDSRDFPTANPLPGFTGLGGDVIVAQLSPSGHQLVYSTYLGGSGSDEGRALAIDRRGTVYLTGSTLSIDDFPTVTPYQPEPGGDGTQGDVFVAQVAPSGPAHQLYLSVVVH